MTDFYFSGFHYEPPKPERGGKRGDKLENQDGSTMYEAVYQPVEVKEEGKMKLQPSSPLTFGSALTLAGSTLLITGLVLWQAYDKIQDQISEVRGEVSTLRSDNREDFNRVADRLDEINKTLTAIQVDMATVKTNTDKSKK